jgi:hypothetical protein
MSIFQSRWMPPMALLFAISGFAMMPAYLQARIVGFSCDYPVVSWFYFVFGPLALFLMACSIIGYLSCRGKEGQLGMGLWFLIGLSVFIASKPFLTSFITT